MTEFNKLQTVKRHFFSMRNGIIADTLRKNGSPYKIIFGLNLPQLRDIAVSTPHDSGLAEALRRNVTTRESQLLFPMLLDPAGITLSEAVELACESTSAEAADILCHSLLRHCAGSLKLAFELADGERPDIARYCAMRILWHHLAEAADDIEAVARREAERKCRLTYMPAMQILNEIEFMRE